MSVVQFERSALQQAWLFALRMSNVLMPWVLADELNGVPGRSRFDRHADREKREEFLQDLARQAEPVEITASVRACRDPGHDRILEPAVGADEGSP